MTGCWSHAPDAYTRVTLTLGDDAAGATRTSSWRLFFNDQRNFGSLTVCVDAALLEQKLSTLGPSWMAAGGLSRERFEAVVTKQVASKRSANVPVAKFLMDQAKTSGIGNCNVARPRV